MSKRALVTLLTALSLISCAAPDRQGAEISADKFVTGTVTYRERVALPPNAVITVKLLDISLADVAAREIASQVITDAQQVPVAFVLRYDPQEIQEGMSYSVRADIRDDDRLLFTTDTVYPVLTRGNGDRADLILIAVAAKETPDAALLETRWELRKIEGNAVSVGPDGPTPYLRLLKDNKAVEGSSGCNRMAGTYTLDGDRIDLGALAMTMMACIDGMETERAFTQALGRMNRYEIRGTTLYGYADETLLLEFAANDPDPGQL